MGIKNNKIEVKSTFKLSFQILMCLILFISIPATSATFFDDLFMFGSAIEDDDINGQTVNDGNEKQQDTEIPFSLGEGTVMISAYQLTPKVLMPNGTGIISVTIKNTGGGSVKINEVTIYSKDLNFSNDNYGYMGILESDSNITVPFKFIASDKDGLYFPEIQIDAVDINSNSVRMVRYPILVNVNTEIVTVKEPELEVENELLNTIKPGDRFNVTLKLKNSGSGNANNVTVNIRSDYQSPFSPINPDNFYTKGIGPEENYEIHADFMSNKNAKLGLYSIPIDIQYSDENGISKKQTETVEVRIRGEPKISITSISYDPSNIEEGDPVTLVIKIKNSGTDDADFVKVSVDLPFEGESSVFLGKIKPGKTVPAVFTFNGDKKGSYLYGITVHCENDGMVESIPAISKMVVDRPSNDTASFLERLQSFIFYKITI